MSISHVRRYHEFDALKVLAALSVFLYHALLPFHPSYPWHIHNLQRVASLDYICATLNLWMVQLFMLLAGASFYLALEKRSKAQFIKDRTVRIFIPFVFGLLVLAPLAIYWERLFYGQFFGSFFEFYPKFFIGYYPYGNFTLLHFWFLIYLFIYCLLGLLVFPILKRPSVTKNISLAAKLCEQRPALIFFPALLHIFLQVTLFWIYPLSYPLTGDIGWHAQLFSLFLLGYLMISENGFLVAIQKTWQLAFVAAIIILVLFFIFRDLISPTYLAPSSWTAFSIEGTLTRAATWFLLIGLLGFGSRYFKNESMLSRYFSQASYPFYILHHFVTVGFVFIIVKTDLPVLPKISSVCILAFTTTLLFYEIFKRIPPLRFLIGIKVQKKMPR